jgi:hypothetical protein
MPGLVPGIHVFLLSGTTKKTWMAGTTPGHDGGWNSQFIGS